MLPLSTPPATHPAEDSTDALGDRDPACRFPGCGHGKNLHAHHIHHWADDSELPAEPPRPRVHFRPAEVLEAGNRACGRRIDAHTGDSLWDGVRLDMAMDIDGLLSEDGMLEHGVSAETGWET